MAKKKCAKCGGDLTEKSQFCPKCGKKIKKNNIVLFFILMVILFVVVIELLFPINYIIFQYGITIGKYGMSAIIELLLVFFIVVVLLLSGNGYVFSEKKLGFFRSIGLALPLLIMSILVFLTSIPSAIEGFNFANFITLFYYCVFIGIYEEFLCRAWLQNEFLERFGGNKKGVITSIILSSLVFGFMHITNVLYSPQGLFETINQVLQCLASGFLFGSVYYKSKNIWSVAFLHGFFDFALMLSSVNLLKDCTTVYGGTASMIFSAISSIMLMAFYVFIGIFALSSSKGNKLFKNNKTPRIVSIIGIISSIILLFTTSLIGTMFYDASESSVCYDFDTITINKGYEIVTPVRDKYSFGNEEHQYTLYLNDNGQLSLSSDENVIVLDYKGTLSEYLVIDNPEYVEIVLNYYDTENIIYHTKVKKEDFKDSMKFLNTIKVNMERLYVPELSYIGYVVFDNDEIKYPFLKAITGESLYIDSDDLLYVIEKE